MPRVLTTQTVQNNVTAVVWPITHLRTHTHTHTHTHTRAHATNIVSYGFILLIKKQKQNKNWKYDPFFPPFSIRNYRYRAGPLLMLLQTVCLSTCTCACACLGVERGLWRLIFVYLPKNWTVHTHFAYILWPMKRIPEVFRQRSGWFRNCWHLTRTHWPHHTL